MFCRYRSLVHQRSEDMPHLVKLARNHFLDKDFNVNGVILSKKSLERLLAINIKDLKVAYKISQYHLDLQGTERQKVLPAVQLLSATTAASLRWCGQKGFLENVEWVETARMIKLLNDWFDIFNSKSMYGNYSGKNAYGKNLEEQNAILHEMTSFMYELRVGNHKSLMLFQKGFIVSSNSLEQLLPYLIEKYSTANIEYVITNRLNQDVLENFFSFIRSNGGGANDQPTALDFKYRVKRYILGKFFTTIFCKNTNVTESERNVSCLISPLNDNNCEEYILSNMLAPYTNEDETTDLHIEEEFLTENEINNNKENRVPCFNSATYIPTLEEEQILKSLDEMEIVDNIEDQGLLYIAGYVAYRFKSKHDTLGIKTCELPIVNDLDWLQFISRGKCMYPSSDLLKAAHIMNTEFSKYHGSKLSKDKFIFKKLTDKIEIALKPIELPREVLLCLVRTRTYIRVREINRTIAVQNRFKNKKKKLTKFTNNKSFS
ncbi:uncharacterized protein LOC143901913 [Temnothorax americanus]|uniref:uncharacterized protein LOC143901913 n=1 Tax=Temnothorax americanus TaxID=1964332 RepID=UPI0040677639